ncbi:hypothetical protein RQP46_001326 [Phenoliferia psychrophenolica]
MMRKYTDVSVDPGTNTSTGDEELGMPTPPPAAANANALRHDCVAAMGELLGTFFFLYFAFTATQSALFRKTADENGTTILDNQTILYISFSFGISLLTTAWVFFRVSGAAFNPAVSFSLWLIGGLSGRRFFMVVPAQLVGAIAAAGLAKATSIGPLNVANGTADGVSDGQALSIELLTTMLLCFTVLMCAAEKSKSTFLAPVVIGLAVFVGHLASVGINPARTLGPAVINLSFPSNSWAYYVGQMTGAIVASVLYVIFKHLDYSKVVAGIDSSSGDASQDISAAPLLKVIGYPSWNTLKDPASDRFSRTIITQNGNTVFVGALGKEAA